MAHLNEEILNTGEKLFKPLHDFSSWVMGDPQSPLANTRRSIFEGLLFIFGTITVNSIWKRINIQQYL